MIAVRRNTAHTVLWIAVVVPFLLFGVLPLAALFVRSFGSGASIATMGSPRVVALLARTLAFAGAAAALSTAIGLVVGLRLGASEWRGKAAIRLILCIPLVLPPYVHALGWSTFVRPGGWLAALVERSLGVAPASLAQSLESWGGATVVLGLALFPIAMLFVEKSLSLTAPSLMEAAEGLGAGRLRALRVGLWPSLRPALASSFAIAFLLAVSDLGVATVLRLDVFSFEVFTQLGAFNDASAATMLCVPILAVGWMLWRLERAGDPLGTAIPDRGAELRGEAQRSQRATTLALAAVVAVPSVAVPLAGIAGATTIDAMRRMAPVAATPALWSAVYGGAAAVTIVVVAVLLAQVRSGTVRIARDAGDAVLMLGFVVPNTILALALLDLFGPYVPASWLVVAALVLRYQVIGYRVIAASVAGVPGEWSEAARGLGAGPWRTFRSIQLPLIAPSVLAAFLVSFLLAATDIGSTILLHSPGHETLPIALYSIEANSPRSYVGAMTLLYVTGIAVPAAALGWLGTRRWRRVGSSPPVPTER